MPETTPRLAAALLRAVRPLDYRRVDECRLVLQWLNAQSGDRILDIGCGDGFYDRRMASAGAVIEAIDVRPARVALAKRRNPHPRVTYHTMQAETLDFEPESFNKAVSICVLEHIPDDEAVLRGVWSALRPGGRLVLSCDSLSNQGVSDSLRARHGRRYAVRHFYTRESLSTLLDRTGFRLTRTDFVLTTPVSLAIARVTYGLDDVARYPGGWLLKFPGLLVAGTLGLAASRLSERLAHRDSEGLTIVAEAVKVPLRPQAGRRNA